VSKDPFQILADELTLIRKDMDRLQRTSLDRDEAEALHVSVAESVHQLLKIGPEIQKAIENRLTVTAAVIREDATTAAVSAAEAAIAKSHAESLEAARSLSQAAGEARREAWRWFGGFWVWLTSVGVTGALLGVLAAFWIGGTIAARDFGDYPGVFCGSAGGQVVKQNDGSTFCAVWIKSPDR